MQGKSALIVCVLVTLTDCARILGVFPLHEPSHWSVMEPLLLELASRGHQLTVYSPFPRKTPVANYTDVDISRKLPFRLKHVTYDILDRLSSAKGTLYGDFNLRQKLCDLLREPEFQELLSSKGTYDLMISEIFDTDCFSYVAYKLRIPSISFMTSVTKPWAPQRLGLPDNPSYIPNYLVPYGSSMNFIQRSYNAFLWLYTKFYHHWVFAEQTRHYCSALLNESLPEIGEVVANTSLVFVNSHYTLSQSRPLTPNVVEVAGIHIKKRQPLPADLQEILKNARYGVIVMSFGSVFLSSSIPKETMSAFMSAFANIPQTVVLKYEDKLDNVPPNVFYKKWLPQRDILEDAKVLLLITHGGVSSVIEAVTFGVPIIGVPLFGDQPANVASVVRRGAGLSLDWTAITEQRVTQALNQLLNNATYKENMMRLSRQFLDRPQGAMAAAVFWTEYVLRHQGARFLQPSSVHLPLYQYLLLDVVFFYICIFIALSGLLCVAIMLSLKTIGKRWKSFDILKKVN